MIVVIPTRNRSDLVANALRSLAAQNCKDRLKIYLSDNSTDTQAVEDNRRAAAESKLNVAYIRPPTSLSMTDHWDWAARHALAASDANHMVFLTDRMLFKPRGVDRLEAVVRLDSGRIVSFALERINDYEHPVIYERSVASYRCRVVPAIRLIELASRMKFPEAMPRMLNCVVPRSLMDRLNEIHGRFFSSVAPDYNFCFRALALIDDYVYFDDPILVHYGLDRSNGAALSRGRHSQDTHDFICHLPSRQEPFPSAPVPALATVVNGIAHEYVTVRAEKSGRAFPPVDLPAYIAANLLEISRFVDPESRRAALALLEDYVAEGHGNESMNALVAGAKRWLYRIITRKRDLTFRDRLAAVNFVLTARHRRSFFDRIRAFPHVYLLRRLRCTYWRPNVG